jgi:hypothetical protein
MLMPSIAGEQPKLCRSAHGDPSNRSLRSNGRHSDGSASPPPDSAPFWSNSCDGMRCECMCVCAAVQIAPILRMPPRKPCDLSRASLMPRTRRLHAVSTWRGSRNGTKLYEPAVCANLTIQPLRIRMVTARLAELTRDSRSERPLPADLSEPAMPAASSLCYAYGPHASRRQQQACVGKAAAGGICACVAMVIVRSDRGHRPERLPRAACSNCLRISCNPTDPMARRLPWATTVALASHTLRGSASLRHRCAVCTADWARAGPATRAASCSAAWQRSHSLCRVRSHRLDHACPFVCDRSPSE